MVNVEEFNINRTNGTSYYIVGKRGSGKSQLIECIREKRSPCRSSMVIIDGPINKYSNNYVKQLTNASNTAKTCLLFTSQLYSHRTPTYKFDLIFLLNLDFGFLKQALFEDFDFLLPLREFIEDFVDSVTKHSVVIDVKNKRIFTYKMRPSYKEIYYTPIPLKLKHKPTKKDEKHLPYFLRQRIFRQYGNGTRTCSFCGKHKERDKMRKFWQKNFNKPSATHYKLLCTDHREAGQKIETGLPL